MLDGKFILEEMMVVIIYFFCDGINAQISQLQEEFLCCFTFSPFEYGN
jgi:hypothetical protein